jgi:hypothetical protein
LARCFEASEEYQEFRAGDTPCCPLCRAPKMKIIPEGQDGALLHFFSCILASTFAVETCHDAFITRLQTRLSLLPSRKEPKSLVGKLVESCITRAEHRESDKILRMLDAAEFVASINLVCLRRLLDLVDQRAASARSLVSAPMRDYLASRPLARDAGPAGRIASARAAVAERGWRCSSMPGGSRADDGCCGTCLGPGPARFRTPTLRSIHA